jgi:flavodoxin I
MENIAVIYGSSLDNTKDIAIRIAQRLGGVEVFDIASIKETDLESFNKLILGTSTWRGGELQDDWDFFLPKLEKVSLTGKTIALFGLGDAACYPDTFVDGMGIIYETIKDKGCTIVGAVPTTGYSYEASRALDGSTFVGLPIDEDNENDLSDARIDNWVNLIRPAFQ